MNPSLMNRTQDYVNRLLHIAGLELVRSHHHWDDPQAYLPFKETLLWAKQASMSVGDYVEATYNVPGATQETINNMAALGVFCDDIQRVCEIGPGSGRYLEKTLQICHPAYYEIYETATDWAKWLAKRYPVTPQPTDGISLSATPTSSIDLVQAHKVFVATPFLTTFRYFLEMMRVACAHGKIVFDVMTEACMDDATLNKWMKLDVQPGLYPNLIPKQYVLNFFCKRGFHLVGSFFVACQPGKTECMVFMH
jgi:hypothetical protein